MKRYKDNFSAVAKGYQKFRPDYPKALFDYLLDQAPRRDLCWDCGTGNGQVAGELAHYFDEIEATDVSEQQIIQAIRKSNITYSVQRAEKTTFPDRSFDLITVAQALHWFDFKPFFQEVDRVLRPGGVLAAWGYGLVSVQQQIDQIIRHFYTDVVGPYWDEERSHIDDQYRSIPFPFDEMTAPTDLSIKYLSSKEHFLAYLRTWSAVQHFKKANGGEDPVYDLETKLGPHWPDDQLLDVSHPIFMRIGIK